MRAASTRNLGDLIDDISAGVSLQGESRPPESGEVGILTLSALSGARLDPTACKAVPSTLAPRLGPYVQAGTILMSRSNTPSLVGACVYVEEDVSNRYLPDLIWQITIRSDSPCSARWLVDYLRSSQGRRKLMRAAAGTSSTMIKLSMDRLRRLTIPVPPPNVQRAITDCSYQFERLVANLSVLVKAKREFKRGLMQRILSGERRFPEFVEPWHESKLGELFIERNELNRPDLSLLSVTADRGVIPRDELEKRDTSNPDKRKYKRVAIGDITYNTMRMWQGVSALSRLDGIVSPAYTVVLPKQNIIAGFAKHLFKFPPVVHLFLRYSQGLVDDTLNLNFDRFAKIKVTIPANLAEQSRIGRVLDLCDEEIKLLEAQRQQVETHKQALLSGLISGEIAVPA